MVSPRPLVAASAGEAGAAKWLLSCLLRVPQTGAPASLGGCRRVALAILLLAGGGCSAPIGMADFTSYGHACSWLAHNVEDWCADKVANTPKGVLDCQLSLLADAGVSAIDDDGKVYCLEPVRPFRSTTAALYNSCRYALVLADGTCYRGHKYGTEPDLKQCIVREMARPAHAGLVPSWTSFKLDKDFALRPGSNTRFQCVNEEATRNSNSGTTQAHRAVAAALQIDSRSTR